VRYVTVLEIGLLLLTLVTVLRGLRRPTGTADAATDPEWLRHSASA
jgi:hypothetical protein